MNNELHRSCRTCQNRRYFSNVCGLTGESVSLTSKSEWAEYLKRWKKAVGVEFATTEKMLKENPTRETKARVNRLREELALAERTEQFVSSLNTSSRVEYLNRREDAVWAELVNAERMLKKNPTLETKAVVKRLRKELASIRSRPLGRVVGDCPHFKQHTTVLPMKCFGDYPNGPCDVCAPPVMAACIRQTEQTAKKRARRRG